MRGARRFSQAITEGDGISLVVEVAGAEAAERAASHGAAALSIRVPVGELAGTLPVLWRVNGSPQDAHEAGADACVLVAAGAREDDERFESLYASGLDLGLDCVVEVGEEEELTHVLEWLDPDVFLLSSRRRVRGDALEHVLELLQDVPAGKLAVGEVPALDRDALAELERAGFDAVLVAAAELADIGDGSPS
ncbi:MAG: hypothetical protein ABR583_12300 [Gaiellaceae bacterium]